MSGMLLLFPLILMIIALVILSIIFWIFMLVDSVKRKYKENNDKIVWVLIIVLVGLIGAIVYYFVVKVEDKKK